MIQAVCKRPALYVGRSCMREVRALLDGYVYALIECGEIEDYVFGGFLRWLEVRNNISHPGWGWDRILVHSAGSEEAAIQSLPQFFAQYCDELTRGIFDPNTARERHFGLSSREPKETCTKDWHDV